MVTHGKLDLHQVIVSLTGLGFAIPSLSTTLIYGDKRIAPPVPATGDTEATTLMGQPVVRSPEAPSPAGGEFTTSSIAKAVVAAVTEPRGPGAVESAIFLSAMTAASASTSVVSVAVTEERAAPVAITVSPLHKNLTRLMDDLSDSIQRGQTSRSSLFGAFKRAPRNDAGEVSVAKAIHQITMKSVAATGINATRVIQSAAEVMAQQANAMKGQVASTDSAVETGLSLQKAPSYLPLTLAQSWLAVTLGTVVGVDIVFDTTDTAYADLMRVTLPDQANQASYERMISQLVRTVKESSDTLDNMRRRVVDLAQLGVSLSGIGIGIPVLAGFLVFNRKRI
jgi:hypothetical protein